MTVIDGVVTCLQDTLSAVEYLQFLVHKYEVNVLVVSSEHELLLKSLHFPDVEVVSFERLHGVSSSEILAAYRSKSM